MQKIKIIAVGTDKEDYFKDAAREYEKRLSRYAKVEIAVLKDEPIPDNASKKEEEAVIKREGDKILAAIPQGYLKIALCIEGKQLSSEEFAKNITGLKNMGKSLAFVIGSSYGLSPRIKNMSRLKLSFSQMTFPHQLFRVMLLEQIYRAFKIDEGSEYHK